MGEIQEFVRLHDQYQFEVKLGYDLTLKSRPDKYKVETFFFIPHSLDINKFTYSKNQFFRDLHLYIRFSTPHLDLKALGDVKNEQSPLNRLLKKINKYKKSPSHYNGSVLEYEIKLMGCIFKSALRNHIRKTERYIKTTQGKTSEKTHELFQSYLKQTENITIQFRSLQETFQNSKLSKEIRGTYTYTDEYISLLLETWTHQLIRALSKLPPHSSIKKTKINLISLIQKEVHYRTEKNYPSIVCENSDNEGLVFRLGVLKKFIGSALHLSVRTSQEGKGLEHFALAAGAGIAMIFATSIAFFYQMIYGTLSLSFFAALVISYMFKDRIKAMIQSYLQKILHKHLFDQSTDIIDSFNNDKIGTCKEMVHFPSEKHIDSEVLRIRNRDHMTEIENNFRSENLLHYIKEITLFSKEPTDEKSRKTRIADIVRFSLRNFLTKMDEPNTNLFLLKKRESINVPGARVYHINVILKSTTQNETRYERIRLILNQQGLKRIEPVFNQTIPHKKSPTAKTSVQPGT